MTFKSFIGREKDGEKDKEALNHLKTYTNMCYVNSAAHVLVSFEVTKLEVENSTELGTASINEPAGEAFVFY